MLGAQETLPDLLLLCHVDFKVIINDALLRSTLDPTKIFVFFLGDRLVVVGGNSAHARGGHTVVKIGARKAIIV